MYTVDLHNHTKFSYDGSNTPEEIIENAIRHGVDVIGITDHQFSIGENLPIYYEYIQHCKIKYADKIKESGIPVSVGSDTHYIAEYRKKQIRRANELLQKLNIPLP